jgi:Sigma-70 region 2
VDLGSGQAGAGSAAQLHSPARAQSLDAEDILQEVFYELVEANRLLMPIEHVTGWLFRVARNRITDLFRKKKPESLSDPAIADDDELLPLEDLLPSPDAGPEALYIRNLLLDALALAVDHCLRSSVWSLLHTSWKVAASRRWPVRPESASIRCFRANATLCFICASDCKVSTTNS